MKVTIEQTAEGFTVSQGGGQEMTAGAEGQEAMAGGQPGAPMQAGAPAGQTVATVDEALQLAKSMLEGGAGGQKQSAAQADAEADALFSGGFNQARGVPLNR